MIEVELTEWNVKFHDTLWLIDWGRLNKVKRKVSRTNFNASGGIQMYTTVREVSRTRRNLKLALNSFENDLHSESYSRKINVKKISKNLYQLANSCVEFRKNSRFPQYFSKYTTFVHIFFYMCTQLTHNFHTCHFRVSKYITHVTHM